MHKFPTVWAVTLIACIATSLWLWRELRSERERADALQTRVVQLEGSQAAWTPEAPGNASPESPARPPQSTTRIQEGTAATKAAAKSENQRSIAGDWGEYERSLLQNSEYGEARRAQRRLELASGHVDLAAVLQISQETADQLIALLVDWELRYLDKPHPNPTNEEELRVRGLEIKEAERVQDAELVALLGKAKSAKWKEYQASLQTRHQVYQLRTTLSASAEPLRDDQIEP